MKHQFIALVALLSTLSLSSGAPEMADGRSLDALLTGDRLWETTQDQFAQNLGRAGIQWLDSIKTRARFFGAGLAISNGKVVVMEANCDFKDGKLASTSISLFNRGDSDKGAATERDFEQQLTVIKDALTAQLGVPPSRSRQGSLQRG